MRHYYPLEVNVFRRRAAKASSALVVAIDADVHPVDRRQQQLQDALAASGLSKRTGDEPIAPLIPKRNIESWLLSLNGEAVNEIDDHHGAKVDELIRDAARAFRDLTRALPSPPPNTLPSLRAAILEALRRG